VVLKPFEETGEFVAVTNIREGDVTNHIAHRRLADRRRACDAVLTKDGDERGRFRLGWDYDCRIGDHRTPHP